MKIVHVTDTHISTSTAEHPSPRKFRVGSYEEDVFSKLEWVRDYVFSLSQECEVVLAHTGDIFDRPTESLRTTIRTADWFQSLKVPVLCAIGQHDIRGHALETLNECSTGVLPLLNPSPIGILDGVTEISPGVNYTSLHACDEHLLDVESPSVLECADVVGTHLSIHPNGYGCTHPNAVLWPNVKLVLCAHIHQGFPVMQNRQGTWFSAPGALVRLNADEVDRQPQIAVIEVSGGAVVQAEYVPVPCKPAADVFDMGAMQQKQDEVKERTEFREAINEVSAEFTGDWRAMLESAREWAGDDTVDKLIPYCERV